jgi:hypothetical protein
LKRLTESAGPLTESAGPTAPALSVRRRAKCADDAAGGPIFVGYPTFVRGRVLAGRVLAEFRPDTKPVLHVLLGLQKLTTHLISLRCLIKDVDSLFPSVFLSVACA